MASKVVHALLAAAALALPSSALAVPTLIGDLVTINALFPNASTINASSTVLVGAGTEVTCPGANPLCFIFIEPTTIDIGATSIVLNEAAGALWTAATYNGLDFTSLDFGPSIALTGFVLTTDLPGLTNGNISFTAHSIRFNAAGLSFANAPYTIRLDLNTSVVPEPATLWLTGLGVVTLAIARRREAKRA